MSHYLSVFEEKTHSFLQIVPMDNVTLQLLQIPQKATMMDYAESEQGFSQGITTQQDEGAQYGPEKLLSTSYDELCYPQCWQKIANCG